MLDVSTLMFPIESEATYYDGPMSFQIDVNLNAPIFHKIVDVDGNEGRVTVVDKLGNLKSLPYTVINPDEGFRTGNYTLKVVTDSGDYAKGILHVAAVVIIPFHEPVFIRKTYTLV